MGIMNARDSCSGNLTKQQHHEYVKRVGRWYHPHVFKKNSVLRRFLRSSGAVVNASSRRLSDVEVEALALGPGFVPWPNTSSINYYGDEIAPFIKRINTAIYFSDPRRLGGGSDRASTVGHLAASGWLKSMGGGGKNSGWTAPARRWTSDPTVARLIRGVSALRRKKPITKNSLSWKNLKKPKPESSKTISDALCGLHSDPAVRVCLSDKGNTVVVWCSESYRREALYHLSTSGCYRKLSGGLEECSQLVERAVSERRDLADHLIRGRHISHAECAAIKSAPARPSPIRFHPKILKPLNAATGTFRGRPIVSTVSSACRPLDKYLALITRPLLAKIPFSCNSTIDLVDRLRDLNHSLTTDYNYLQQLGIYTADIVSLFPSVRWESGVSACVAFYSEWFPWLVRFFASDNKLAPPSPELFSDLVNFVVRNSLIHFSEDDSYYQQTSGVAMGACISVYVANCYVWSAMRPVCLDLGLAWKPSSSGFVDSGSGFGDSGSSVVPSGFSGFSGSSSTTSDIIFLARYVDDFLAISRSASSFDFVLSSTTENSSGRSIAFSRPADGNGMRSNVSFLDLKLSIDSASCSISSRPRLDSSPGCSYLHAGSCHPPHLLRSIPYAQMTRLKRNSSDDRSFVSSAAVLAERLKMRGYSTRLVKKALAIARLGRPQRHQPTTQPSQPRNRFKFIATYDGGEIRHWRSVRRRLDRVLARASDFYEGDSNPIGEMLGRSKATIVFKKWRPNR